MADFNEASTSEDKAKGQKKPLRIRLIIGLIILVLIVAAFILALNQFGTSEDTQNWFEDYFKKQTASELTKAQLDVISKSAVISSNIAEDAGVKITLVSMTGNGYFNWYKIDVELPEDMNAGIGYGFEKQKLLTNDDSCGLGNSGCSSRTLEDGDPTDNKYSLMLTTRLSSYYGYSFDNGIVRTLHLENIVTDEGGKRVILIDGQWNFDIIIKNKGEYAELIGEPVTLSGTDMGTQTRFESTITSFVLTGFTAHCIYENSPESESEMIGISPVIVLKDGSRVALLGSSGSDKEYDYYLSVPISLDEVDYVKLTAEVSLTMD